MTVLKMRWVFANLGGTAEAQAFRPKKTGGFLFYMKG